MIQGVKLQSSSDVKCVWVCGCSQSRVVPQDCYSGMEGESPGELLCMRGCSRKLQVFTGEHQLWKYRTDLLTSSKGWWKVAANLQSQYWCHSSPVCLYVFQLHVLFTPSTWGSQQAASVLSSHCSLLQDVYENSCWTVTLPQKGEEKQASLSSLTPVMAKKSLASLHLWQRKKRSQLIIES